MSTQRPDSSVRRRRIAGERRPAGQPTEPARPMAAGAEPPRTKTRTPRSRTGGLPLAVLAVLAVLTAVAVGVAAYFWYQAEQAEAVAQARQQAPAAAERAAEAILSYDHESLEADKRRAASFMTEDYRADYVKTFDELVADNAEELDATVTASVRASSVMLPGADTGADRQQVLLFVNQVTESTANEEPQTAVNRVRMEMTRVDGAWLVDSITAY